MHTCTHTDSHTDASTHVCMRAHMVTRTHACTHVRVRTWQVISTINGFGDILWTDVVANIDGMSEQVVTSTYVQSA